MRNLLIIVLIALVVWPATPGTIRGLSTFAPALTSGGGGGDPAFGAGAILDTFDRSDENPVAGSWTYVGAAPGYYMQMDLVSNQIKDDADTGGQCFSSWDGASFGPAIQVYVTIATPPDTDAVCGVSLLVDHHINLIDGYVCQVKPAALTDSIELFRYDDDTPAFLGDVDQEVAAGDAIGLERSGTDLKIWFKAAAGSWTLLDTISDATYTPTRAGLYSNNNGTYRMDNFSARTTP